MAGLVPAIHDLNSLDPQDSLRSPGASPRHGRACPGHPRLELARSPGLAALARGPPLVMAGLVPAIHDLNSLDPRVSLRSSGDFA